MGFKKLAAVGALCTMGFLAVPAFSSSASAAPSVLTAGEGKLSHDAEECIKALEAGEPVENCQKSPNPILPATDELIWGTVAFAAILLMMWKFAVPAIKKTMAARSARIEGDLASADKAKGDADTMIAEYKAKLADAQSESNRIIDEARQQADAVRKDLIGRAEADASAIRAKASEDLNAQADRLKADLQAHVKGLSLDLAEKVVGANMNKETNAALVDRYIAELSKN